MASANQLLSEPFGMRRFRPRELIQQFLSGTLGDMKLLDQYEAAGKVRRLAPR